jgi:large subunit ribosomal protein L22
MDVRAYLRNLRMSPRKVRLVIDMVRGLPVEKAITQLTFLRKDAALPVLKLLKSAMANASHNHQVDSSTLFIKTITADGGATIKRFRPRAHGSAAPIRKRTTHITIVLSNDALPVSRRMKRTAARKAAHAARPPKPRAVKTVPPATT